MKYLLFLLALCIPSFVLATEFDMAKELVKQNKAACVILKNNKIIAQADGKGISPLLDLYDKSPNELNGADLVDKVIGRAAAFVAINAGIKTVYGEIMSEDAVTLLETHSIPVTYNILVPKILNRNKDGLCPLEQSVMGIEDKNDALSSIRKRIMELRSANKK